MSSSRTAVCSLVTSLLLFLLLQQERGVHGWGLSGSFHSQSSSFSKNKQARFQTVLNANANSNNIGPNQDPWVNGFKTASRRSTRNQKKNEKQQTDDDSDGDDASAASAAFSVPASEIEKDLQEEERTTVRVVRQVGPSVAFVTSVWPTTTTTSAAPASSRRNATSTADASKLPRGVSLGSGSAFVVDPNGYLVTNYHVVERAYQMQRMEEQMRHAWDQIVGNLTSAGFSKSLLPFVPNSTGDTNAEALLESMASFLGGMMPQSIQRAVNRPPPVVYIRLANRSTQYRKCRVVHVQPDLDLAILQIDDEDDDEVETFSAMEFGSSSNLLVGQGLIAIGNPFGLDNSVTTGVVSALNRELRAGYNNPGTPIAAQQQQQPIRNCIQTDCAINPGNSGGPLLNLQGQVVGVNTAIVSTTGSFSGIGFAVPSDAVQPVVERIIRNDKVQQGSKRRGQRSSVVPWLGVKIVQTPQAPDLSSSSATRRVVGAIGNDDEKEGGVNAELLERYVKTSRLLSSNDDSNTTTTTTNWILRVAPDSPAEGAGMRGMRLDLDQAKVIYGDAIVAIGGNAVENFADLQTEIQEQRKVGEQVAITLEDGVTGERRVVYLVLTEPPSSSSSSSSPSSSSTTSSSSF